MAAAAAADFGLQEVDLTNNPQPVLTPCSIRVWHLTTQDHAKFVRESTDQATDLNIIIVVEEEDQQAVASDVAKSFKQPDSSALAFYTVPFFVHNVNNAAEPQDIDELVLQQLDIFFDQQQFRSTVAPLLSSIKHAADIAGIKTVDQLITGITNETQVTDEQNKAEEQIAARPILQPHGKGAFTAGQKKLLRQAKIAFEASENAIPNAVQIREHTTSAAVTSLTERVLAIRPCITLVTKKVVVKASKNTASSTKGSSASGSTTGANGSDNTQYNDLNSDLDKRFKPRSVLVGWDNSEADEADARWLAAVLDGLDALQYASSFAVGGTNKSLCTLFAEFQRLGENEENQTAEGMADEDAQEE